MNEFITEKIYSIDNKFLVKNLTMSFLIAIFFSFYIIEGIPRTISDIYAASFVIMMFGLVSFIFAWLWRKFFHFTLDQKFLTVHQGILSKTRKDFPYGVIQNVHLKQDLLDRLLGIASVMIENASMAGGNPQSISILSRLIPTKSNKQEGGVGISGNKVIIPALTKNNAELLKTAILQKMKENPLDDYQSGL